MRLSFSSGIDSEDTKDDHLCDESHNARVQLNYPCVVAEFEDS